MMMRKITSKVVQGEINLIVTLTTQIPIQGKEAEKKALK